MNVEQIKDIFNDFYNRMYKLTLNSKDNSEKIRKYIKEIDEFDAKGHFEVIIKNKDNYQKILITSPTNESKFILLEELGGLTKLKIERSYEDDEEFLCDLQSIQMTLSLELKEENDFESFMSSLIFGTV